MTAPTLTPAERIARFVKAHPGEWQTGNWQGEGSPSTKPAAVLPIWGGMRVVVIDGDLSPIVWILRRYGEHVDFVGHHVSMEAPLLARVSSRVADAVQLRGEEGCIDTLPSWLADPVRRELRRRAGELLTLAGSSPADVVSAAETVDEALCQRAPVAPTFSDVLAALQASGMSCGWVQDPGDTGINPEREALEDARVALSCADDAMTREQYVNLLRDLRRVLGVT